METKSKTKLWLIDKCVPSALDQCEFNGAYPPTTEDVLLKVLAYRKAHTGLLSDAVSAVRKDVELWWARTGIKLICNYGIDKQIQNIFKVYYD